MSARFDVQCWSIRLQTKPESSKNQDGACPCNDSIQFRSRYIRNQEGACPCNDSIQFRKGEVRPLILSALINNACDKFPQHKALIVSGKFEVTYAELQRLVNRCAAKLRNAGIGTRDVVALTFPNSFEYVILFFTVLRARAIVAPVNPVYTEEELEFYLEDSGSLKGNPACIHSFCHMVALTTNDSAPTKTTFGSSYMEGKHIFDLQTEQAILVVESFRNFLNFLIPGYRFLPARSNLKGRGLDREIQRSMREIIGNREKNMRVEEVDENKDLFGLILMAAKKGTEENHLIMSFQDMIDECKTFFVARHETPSILFTWTIILLAMHTDWQDLAREEVLRLCKNEAPNAEFLSRLKIVNMVLHEVLRLYPPLPFMVRTTCKTMKLGSLSLPKGTEITIPIAAVHPDKELWEKMQDSSIPNAFLREFPRLLNIPWHLCLSDLNQESAWV